MEKRDSCRAIIFKDGKMVKDYTLDEIRQRLNGGEF